jgi:cobalt/nickel transport system permease protein
MAGQLFLRSYERSDRIYNAMLSRGYKGELMTIHPHQFEKRDLVIGAFSILVLILIQLAGRML